MLPSQPWRSSSQVSVEMIMSSDVSLSLLMSNNVWSAGSLSLPVRMSALERQLSSPGGPVRHLSGDSSLHPLQHPPPPFSRAGRHQSGGEVTVKPNGQKVKLFYGMSSSTAMEKHSGGVAEYRSV